MGVCVVCVRGVCVCVHAWCMGVCVHVGVVWVWCVLCVSVVCGCGVCVGCVWYCVRYCVWCVWYCVCVCVCVCVCCETVRSVAVRRRHLVRISPWNEWTQSHISKCKPSIGKIMAWCTRPSSDPPSSQGIKGEGGLETTR